MPAAASPKRDSARSTASGRGTENHAMMRVKRSEDGLSLFTTCGGRERGGSEPGTQSQSSLVLDHVRGAPFAGSGPKHGEWEKLRRCCEEKDTEYAEPNLRAIMSSRLMTQEPWPSLL